ncbi:MAG: c-type cytochrome [Candidatus Acidiferrales bacterium]
MKKLGIALLVLLVLITIAITFTVGWRPFIGSRMRPLTNRTFESTPARLARGSYIFHSVSLCVDCHSPHENTSKDWPVIDGKEGSGQPFPLVGLPGQIVAPNITPDSETGIGNWTDDQIARAIREGVDKDGHTLFPMMPYGNYRSMSDEDLASVVVFLRSMPPVRNPLPSSQIIFPVKYLIRNAPEPLTSAVPPADSSTPVKRGEYLALIGNCADCHTPQKRGQPIAGMNLSGGFVMTGPWGSAATANITPDATGISYYDEKLFADAIRTGLVHARKLNVIMPWQYFHGMTDQDVSDIFAYIKSVPAVAHRVDNTETPTLCKKCGNVHGLGDKN